MRRLKRGGWPYSQPPNVQFEINLDSPQSKGLEAWWPTLGSRGANVLRDFSGHGHHAPLEANAAWLNTPQLGFALDTSGDGAAIVPEGNTLDPPEGSITLSIWVYYATSEASRHIIAKVDEWGANTQRWFMKFQHLNVQWGSTQGTFSFNGAAEVGALHLYTLTDDGINSRLYRDGLLFGTQGSLTFDNDAGSRVSLGKAVQVGTYLDGWLADPRLYSRVFTPTQCWELFDPYTRWELSKPLIRRFPGWRAAAVGDQTIMMGALTVAGSTPVLTQASGAVAIAVDALTLAGSAQTLTWAGVNLLTMNALTLAGSTPALTQVSGATSILVDALTLVGSAESLTQSSGAVSIAVDALTLAGSVPNLTQVSGAVSIIVDALILAGTAESLTVAAGIIIGLDALTLAGSVPNLTQVSGAVAIAVNALTLAGSTPNLTWAGEVSVILDALTLAGSTPSLTQVSGAVSIILDALTLIGTAPNLIVALAGLLKVDASLSIAEVTAALLDYEVVTTTQLDHTLVTAAASVIHTRD